MSERSLTDRERELLANLHQEMFRISQKRLNPNPTHHIITTKETTDMAVTMTDFDKLRDEEKYFDTGDGIDRCGVCTRPKIMTDDEREDVKQAREQRRADKQREKDQADARARDEQERKDRAKCQDKLDELEDTKDLLASYNHGLSWAMFFGIVSLGILLGGGVLSVLGDWFSGIYITCFIVGPIGLAITIIATIAWVSGHQDGKDSPKHQVAKAQRAYDRVCMETGQVGITLGGRR